MALLSTADQDKLRESFGEMTSSVRVLFFTQTLGCETCLHTRQILDELPALSDKIAIEEVNFVLEKERAAQYGIDRVPALALVAENGNGLGGGLGFVDGPNLGIGDDEVGCRFGLGAQVNGEQERNKNRNHQAFPNHKV